MFNRYGSDPYLLPIIAELARCGAEAVEFQVSDTLQRHNLQWKGFAVERAYEHAQFVGLNWAKKNCSAFIHAFEKFKKVEISRWDYWVRDAHFRYHYEKVFKVFEEDGRFRDSVYDVIEGYMQSVEANPSLRAVMLSKEFILEEIAVSDLSALKDPCIELYPGPRLAAEVYLAENHSDKFSFQKEGFLTVEFGECAGE